MKRLILSLAVLSVALMNAQKKEIANAVKAVDSGDLTTANSELSKAEGIFGDKTYLLEPSILEQYYYAKGLSLLKAGKNIEGAEVLAKISSLGSEPIFTGKDADKNKVYFVGKEAADKSGSGLSLKEDKYSPALTEKLRGAIDPLLRKANEEATTNYNNKKFDVAGANFAETYYLFKAAGQDNKNFLYYAGVAYAQTPDKKAQSTDILQSLIKSNYTGEETVYTAKNTKSGQVETLDKAAFDLYKKANAGYTDFKTEKTPSKQEELYEVTASLLFEQQKYEEAGKVAEEGLKKFPKNQSLGQVQSNSYFKSGKTDEFVNNLKAKIAANPNDKESLYNLGVMLSKDPSKQAEAEATFKKLVEMDSKFPNALNNLVFAILGEDEAAINQYRDLKKAGKIDEANKVLEQRRARFQKALPYAEKLYANEPNNKEVVTLLKGMYMTTQNTAKYNEFKAKEAGMK
ncbi:tetratricopeptide repeat protein [Epilithonimonas sp.]|uniref:tetratricopeptide repeat protein n=1 Tax=Epilithonimonas sp. TaxID=2894511 RepID=UPI002FDCA692